MSKELLSIHFNIDWRGEKNYAFYKLLSFTREVTLREYLLY